MTTNTARAAQTLYTAETFTYVSFDIDEPGNTVRCHYRLDDWDFTETVAFPGGGDWSSPAVAAVARWVFLLAGVSYYKAGAPPVIDLGDTALTDGERAFLREFYVDGLGEFAFRSDPPLDLTGIEVRGPRLESRGATAFSAAAGSPLVPFGGGVDSIVTTEMLRAEGVRPALFVVNRPGDRFEAIEAPAGMTGLPVVRAERVLDPQILRSSQLGFRNGHVPVTGVISAIAVLAAALGGHDAVVMSNEWSASVGTVEVDGRSINHQYSKSFAFETGFRGVLAEAMSPAAEYFSMLRPFTELRIAREFADLDAYFTTFRSCNRAFHIDRERRLGHWCAHCDKCCFIDLILAPFVDASTLRAVFAEGGPEPLENPELAGTFENLLGLVPGAKPWECVGDTAECRTALTLAAGRDDRHGATMISRLLRKVDASGLATPSANSLLPPIGDHHIPERYRPSQLTDRR